jgi:hypothetical protein
MVGPGRQSWRFGLRADLSPIQSGTLKSLSKRVHKVPKGGVNFGGHDGRAKILTIYILSVFYDFRSKDAALSFSSNPVCATNFYRSDCQVTVHFISSFT